MILPELTEAQRAQLSLYQEEILRWNTRINLIGRSTVANFEDDHLRNSLEIIPFLKGNLPLIDVGTGGGLPGIPLAIALPERQIWLADIDQKKLSFLHYIVAKLKLSNTRVLDILPSVVTPEPCDIVSRAYGPIPRIFAWADKHAPHAQTYYLLKGEGVHEEIAQTSIKPIHVIPLSRGCLAIFLH